MSVFTRDKSFYKTLISLAVPISLQNLITFAVGFADNLMIGRLGDNAISGVYVGNQMQAVVQRGPSLSSPPSTGAERIQRAFGRWCPWG